MIVLETKLKKIPNSCSYCPYSIPVRHSMDRQCRITGRNLASKLKNGHWVFPRPSKCPLKDIYDVMESELNIYIDKKNSI